MNHPKIIKFLQDNLDGEYNPDDMIDDFIALINRLYGLDITEDDIIFVKNKVDRAEPLPLSYTFRWFIEYTGNQKLIAEKIDKDGELDDSDYEKVFNQIYRKGDIAHEIVIERKALLKKEVYKLEAIYTFINIFYE